DRVAPEVARALEVRDLQRDPEQLVHGRQCIPEGMRIVVAGANGLIGRALFSALRERGGEAVAPAARAAGREGWAHGGRGVEWDGRSRGAWASALDGADAVVNLAGAPVAQRWTEAHKRAIRDSRVESSRALVEAMGAAQKKPRAFVAGCAVGYYGDRGDEVL